MFANTTTAGVGGNATPALVNGSVALLPAANSTTRVLAVATPTLDAAMSGKGWSEAERAARRGGRAQWGLVVVVVARSLLL